MWSEQSEVKKKNKTVKIKDHDFDLDDQNWKLISIDLQ